MENEKMLLGSKVFYDVYNERLSQNEKWGEQNHHPMEWLSILGEEFGEAAQAANEAHFSTENKNNWKHYREELVQVAAVAVAMIECLDRNGK